MNLRQLVPWLLVLACTEASPPAPEPPLVELRREDLGIAFTLPPPWFPDGEASSLGATTWRRPPLEAAAPMVTLTVEPAEGSAAEAFERVQRDVDRLRDKPGVTVQRLDFSSYDRGSIEVGELHLKYRVQNLVVRQRSSLFFRSELEPVRRLVTVTATYLDRDAELVEPELARSLERVELFLPTTAGDPIERP